MNGYIKGQPDTTWWFEQILLGEKWRKRLTYEDNWKTWRSWYRGEWGPGVSPNNVFFQMIRTLLPRIYFRNPSVSINPELPGPEALLMARLLEQLDNKLFRILRLKEQVKRIVFNGVMFGTGIGELGFGSQFAPTPDVGSTEPAEKDQHGRPVRLEYNDLVQADMPWFLSNHPGRVVIPVGSQDIHTARWYASRITRSLYDLQDDPRFRNTALLKTGSSDFRLTNPNQTIPEPVDVYTIRDKRTGKVFVISRQGDGGAKSILYYEDDAFLSDGSFPAFPLVMNQDDENFWGIPDAQILTPLQIEANDTRSLIMKHKRSSLVKIIYEDGAIDPDELTKLDDRNVRAALKAKNINALKEFQPGGIPPALLEGEQLTTAEVEKTLGLGVNQFGEYAPGSSDRSATEAAIVNQATQIRIDERRDAVADMLTAVTGKMHQVIFTEWHGEHVVDILGLEGARIWVSFSGDMLKSGRYQVNIDPDTSLPETKMLREQKAVQIFQLLKNDPMINQLTLRQMLMGAFYGPQYQHLVQPPQPQVPGNTPSNPIPLWPLLQHMRGAANPHPKTLRPSTAALGHLAGVVQ
ncbi:MAG: hypothetical protein ACREBW_08585 [Candidatus Micrarchaeaceae archaeon]